MAGHGVDKGKGAGRLPNRRRMSNFASYDVFGDFRFLELVRHRYPGYIDGGGHPVRPVQVDQGVVGHEHFHSHHPASHRACHRRVSEHETDDLADEYAVRRGTPGADHHFPAGDPPFPDKGWRQFELVAQDDRPARGGQGSQCRREDRRGDSRGLPRNGRAEDRRPHRHSRTGFSAVHRRDRRQAGRHGEPPAHPQSLLQELPAP